MNNKDFTTRQKMLIELCVRSILCDLLDRDQIAIDDFTAGLHNINVGSFGDKDYKFEDTNDWVACLQDLRDIIAILDPVYHQMSVEFGSQPYKLDGENLT